MKWFLSVIVLLSGIICYAQENYSYVDSKILRIPQSRTYSTDSIAKYILDNFSADKEKIRAVYTWITHNIEYSKDSMLQFNKWGIDPEINMNAILRRRKGVCENYAALFVSILQKCGVHTVVVTGYTNIPGNDYWNGHGWAAVEADKEWYLCDPTWDAGTGNYRYFLIRPDEFIETHMPFDPLWQLLDHPVSHKDFQRGWRHSNNDTAIFNYKDSVNAYLLSDTLQQMEAASRRMLQSGFDNEDVKTWYSYNQMKMHIVLQEENMQLYNGAVEHLNHAKKLYNEFVNYRNSRFSPAQSTAAITALFNEANRSIESAYKKIALIGKKSENYQYDTGMLLENLDALKEKIRIQEDYWKQYLTNTQNPPAAKP